MKRVIALALALLCLTGCGVKADNPEAASLQESIPGVQVSPSGAGAEEIQEDPQVVIGHTLVFLYGEQQFWYRGQAYPLTVAPFLEEGVLYVPLMQVAVLLGGSVVRSGDLYYLNFRGNVSVMAQSYNVLLYNNDAFIMDRTPVIREGEFCLPVDGLAKVLAMQVSRDPEQQIVALGMGMLGAGTMKAVRQALGYDALAYQPNPTLVQISGEQGLEEALLTEYAVYRQLWVSDEEGTITELWLDDAGALRQAHYSIPQRFPENRVFTRKLVDNQVRLWDIGGKKAVSGLPQDLYVEALRSATARYMELTAAQRMLGDAQAGILAAGYFQVLSGELENDVYLGDLEEPYETGLYGNNDPEEDWQNLLDRARVGDFLVFRDEQAGAEYGFFNHAALILEIDREKGIIRLLQARGAEYGVGADEEMDLLSWESLNNHDFYSHYGTIFLCGAGALSENQRQAMVWKAYEKYNGYQFGYGGRMGLEETNCTELVDEAYLAAGVDIIDGDYESRLKEVLKGNTKNLVLIPDDLLFSGKTEVKAVWTR